MDKYKLSKEELAFFTYLYKTFYAEVCKYISIITRNRLPREDIAQETFLVALNKIVDVKQHPNPDKWLFVTARNIAYDTLNKGMNTREIPTVMEELNLVGMNNTEVDFLFSDLEKILTSEEVSLLKKRFFEGYTIKEISNKQAANPGSTRMKFSRIYKKIRESDFFVALLGF